MTAQDPAEGSAEDPTQKSEEDSVVQSGGESAENGTPPEDDATPAARSEESEPGPREEPAAGRRRNVVLYAVAVLLAGAVVAAAVLLVDEVRGDPVALPRSGVEPVALTEAGSADQERTAAILAAASEEAAAFVNISHTDVDAAVEAVLDGATGEFREQYEKSSEAVTKVLRRNRSVMEGEVLWAGVVTSDEDSATVVVATSGTVSNNATENQPVAKNFRLQLELVEEDGRWLTNDLQIVP